MLFPFQLLEQVVGQAVEDAGDVADCLLEIDRFKTVGAPSHDIAPVELDRESGRVEQKLHRAGVEDVEGPAAVFGLDVKAAAELGRLEIDVVIAEKLGDFVEKAFGPDH